MARSVMLDLYCTGCDSDQHTGPHPNMSDHHMTWCSLCWDWQKPIGSTLRKFIDDLVKGGS